MENRPSIAAYEAAHPECAAQIRELFPAVQAMEQIALRRQEPVRPASLRAGMPERLGDFRMIREIGRGGMGVVYEAEQESLSRHVAVKVLAPFGLAPSRDAAAIRARSPDRGATAPHEYRARIRRGRGSRLSLHRHAVDPGRGARQDSRSTLAVCAGATPASSRTRSLPSTIATGDTIDETTAVARALVRGAFYRKRSSDASSASIGEHGTGVHDAASSSPRSGSCPKSPPLPEPPRSFPG